MSNKYIEAMIDLNPEALKVDGFDDCIIGIVESFSNYVFLYSREKLIDQLCKDMSEIEAYEYYGFNILGSYVGDHMPIFLLQEESYV